MPVDLLAFVGVAALTIMTPGPDTALILRNTIRGGRTAGLANVGGLAVGITVWSAATVVGLTAVLLAFSPLYTLIRFAGALYLMVLGLQALRSVFRADASRARDSERPRDLRRGRRSARGCSAISAIRSWARS